LGKKSLIAGRVNWIAGHPPTLTPFRADVKIRYKSKFTPATVTPLDDGSRVSVEFDAPLRDITPGQGAVFYELNGDVCFGGGIILRTSS
jgi:tRNA-specific 2-thiouridylase